MKKMVSAFVATMALVNVSSAAVPALKGLRCFAYNLGGVAELKLNEQGVVESVANGFVKNTYEPVRLEPTKSKIGHLEAEHAYLVLKEAADHEIMIVFSQDLVEGKQTVFGQLANVAKKSAINAIEPRVSPLDYIPLANVTCDMELGL